MKSEPLSILLESTTDGELGDLLKQVVSSKQFHIFESVMEDVREEYFIDDAIHGISHNERVALLAMIIGIHENLSDDELKVVIKSALYHDIGRATATGRNHGIESARIIEENKEELASGFNDSELSMVEFLCSIHSNPDEEIEKFAFQYNLDINLARKLMNILKDADALDRVRLPRFGKLDPEKLRLEYSKGLVETSKSLLNTYKSIQYDLGIAFDTDIFNSNEFNIIEDDDNIYIFRALNPDNESDMDNPDIDVVRTKGHVTTDNGGEIKYSPDGNISLEEVYSNVRVARTGKNNNCISFSSNSNVTMDYAAGRYVMYAIPKNGDRSVVHAGKYMLEEISKRISAKLRSEKNNSKIIDILAQIDAETSVDGIRELVGESFDSIEVRSEPDRRYTGKKGAAVSRESLISRFEGKQFFSSVQELEYCKIIAKLTVLEMHGIIKSILPSQLTNTMLINAIGSAFSSSEFIHYGDIDKSKVTELSRESVELFAIIQQMQELDGIDKDAITLLKQKVLENIKNNTEITIDENITTGDTSTLKPEDIIDLLKKPGESKKIIPYYTGSSAIEYMRNYALAKVRAAKLLDKIKNQFEDEEQKRSIELLIAETIDKVITPNSTIIGRRNNRGIKLAESVNLDLNPNKELTIFSLEEQQKLITALNNLSYKELEKIANGDYTAIIDNQILTDCINSKEYPNGENDYYIDYIVDSIDLEEVYKVSNVRFDKRSTIKELLRSRLHGVDVHKLYNALSDAGISYELIPNYVVNLLLEDGYGEYDSFEELVNAGDMEDVIKANVNNLNSKITAFSLDRFLGIMDNSYNVPDTNIVLREYQEFAVNGVDEIHQNRRFAGVVLPTGAGKSFVAMAQLMKYQKKNILYFAPQEEILNQFQRHILKYILNKSVLTLEDIDEMESMSNSERQEFLKNKVYNQDADIASELKKLKDSSLTEEERDKIKRKLLPRKTEKYDDVMDAIRLVFPHLEMHCYQGLNSSEYQELLEKNADLVVLDELHRTGAETWQPRIKELLEKNENAKILGITATPVRDDVDHADMMKFMAENYGGFTREEIEDKAYLAEEMYLVDAMQNKYVVEPKLVSFTSSLGSTEEYQFVVEKLDEERAKNPSSQIVRDLEAIKSRMDEIINGSRDAIEDNLSAVGEVIAQNIPVSLKNGRFIVFLPRKPGSFTGTSEEYIQSQIDKINEMLKTINPDIDSGYLLSNRKEKSKNSEAVTNFENADNEFLKVLYAINMLNEGVHVENINGEIMLRPIGSGSNILYFQQIGRVIFSIDPNNPPKEDEIPIIFDVYNNYLTRDLDRAANRTTPTSDLNNIQIVKNWINRHERMPDINSEDHDEARKAIILKKIQEKYEGYLNGINGENLSVTEIRQIERILEIAKSINLFDIDIPDRIIPPGEKELGRVNVFEVKGEVRDFLDLFKESKKIVKNNESKSRSNSSISDVLRIRNVMSILQVLNQYGFNITDENLKNIFIEAYPEKAKDANMIATRELTLLDVIEHSFSDKTKEAVLRDLSMSHDELEDYRIYEEFKFAQICFTSKSKKLRNAFSIYDITDIRKCGILKQYGRYISAVNENGFVTEAGPKIFKDINIYTGTNYDENGYNIHGFDIFGYDKEGYDEDGYDRDLFKKGSSINKYGFNHDKIHTETGTHLDPNFFDFYGDYWEADPEFPNDITKRINTHQKVNGANFNRDNQLCVQDSDGVYVPKFTDRFYDKDGHYWKPDPEAPDDVTRRINTQSIVNEDFFDVNGYFYVEDENGTLVNTGRKCNDDGFDCNHLYHKLIRNGKGGFSRKEKPAGEYDDDGYNFYGLDQHNFNRDHMYVDENGNTSLLNPEGVGYDGYVYEFDEETQSYIKKEKYYDEEGYDFDGLNVDLFDRDHLYMHKRKWTPKYYFDWKHQYRGQPDVYYDDYGFDYKQDYKGIPGRKYDTHNFDRDGFLYELNPETGEMEKTTKTINDDHFDRDGFYYEYGEYVKSYYRTDYKYNPHGVNIDGDFDRTKIRDSDFLEELCTRERSSAITNAEAFLPKIDELESTIKTLEQEIKRKVKILPEHLVGKRTTQVIEDAYYACKALKSLIEEVKTCEKSTLAVEISEKMPMEYSYAQRRIKDIEKEINNLDEKIEAQEAKKRVLDEKTRKRQAQVEEFTSKFDENGICIETGLRYDKNYFMANKINIVTNTEKDIRGFEFSGACRDNNMLPYDKNGFRIDGTHYITGERYHNGYNAYGVDENGKDRNGRVPTELFQARKYISAMFDSGNPKAYADFLRNYMRNNGITTSQTAFTQLRIMVFKASEMYPPFKDIIIQHIKDLTEKISKQSVMIEGLRAKGTRFAAIITTTEKSINNLKTKLSTLSFDIGDK